MQRRKFLVGVDGSPAALAALRCATDLISSKEDHLLLLSVYENHISSVLHVEPGTIQEEAKIHNQREAAAQKHLEEALIEVHKLLPGFENVHGLLRGSPAVGETITKLAFQESKWQDQIFVRKSRFLTPVFVRLYAYLSWSERYEHCEESITRFGERLCTETNSTSSYHRQK